MRAGIGVGIGSSFWSSYVERYHHQGINLLTGCFGALVLVAGSLQLLEKIGVTVSKPLVDVAQIESLASRITSSTISTETSSAKSVPPVSRNSASNISAETPTSISAPPAKSGATQFDEKTESTPKRVDSFPAIQIDDQRKNSDILASLQIVTVREIALFAYEGKDTQIASLMARLADFPKPQRGDRKEARKLLEEGLALFRQEKYQQASEVLYAANKADPLDVQITNDYGFALLRNGELDRSESVLASTLILSASRASAWFNLGELFALRGDHKRAVGSYFITWLHARKKETAIEFLTKQANSDDRDELRRAALATLKLIESRQATELSSTQPQERFESAAIGQSPISSKWIPVAKLDGRTFFIDRSTVEKRVDMRSATVLVNEVLPPAPDVWSTSIRYDFECRQIMLRTQSESWFSEEFAAGKLMGHRSEPDPSWVPVLRGTVAAKLLSSTCSQ